MKRFLVVLLMVCSCALAKESISPMVGEKFGAVMTLEVEFVDKPNTYWAQNVVKEPWLAKVISVNNVKLGEPVVIEYRSETEGFVKDKRYVLRGYEDIWRNGFPTGWSEEPEQFTYQIHHRLILDKVRP